MNTVHHIIRTACVAIIAAAAVVAAVALAIVASPSPSPAADVPTTANLPACATEDGSECYWDARQHGNGEGRSFVNVGGTTYYLG